MPKLNRDNTTEHILNREQAETYLTHRINNDKEFNQIVADKSIEYDMSELSNGDVSETVLDGISGVADEKSFYTAESIDRMPPEYFGKLIDYEHTEIQGVRDEMATATMAVTEDTLNDEIYTTDEMIRSNEYTSENYPEAVNHAFEVDTNTTKEIQDIVGDDYTPKMHDTQYMDFDQLEQINNLQDVSQLGDEDLQDLSNEEDLKM